MGDRRIHEDDLTERIRAASCSVRESELESYDIIAWPHNRCPTAGLALMLYTCAGGMFYAVTEAGETIDIYAVPLIKHALLSSGRRSPDVGSREAREQEIE